MAALQTAAPGHVELVRSVMFDGLSDDEQQAFGVAVAVILGRLRSANGA